MTMPRVWAQGPGIYRDDPIPGEIILTKKQPCILGEINWDRLQNATSAASIITTPTDVLNPKK